MAGKSVGRYGGRAVEPTAFDLARLPDVLVFLFTALPPFRRTACPAHFTYSLSPSRPPSRPKPLSRYPPKPLGASNTLVQLMQTVPALSCGGTSSARLMSSVQTLAARP